MARDRNSRDAWEQQLDEEPRARRTSVFEKLKNNRWVRENPNLVKGIAAGALLLMMVLLFRWQMGWSSGTEAKTPAEKTPTRATAESQPSASPPTSPVQAPPASQSQEPSKPSEQKLPSPTQKAVGKQEQKPPLPDNMANWRKEDYVRARRENHPKLLEAIARLGEKSRGSAAAAEGLTALLKPLAPAAPSGPGSTPAASGSTPAVPMRNQTDLAKLVETIVAALGDNGADAARKTLEQILAGTLTTEDDKAAVEAVLKTLVAHPCAENDALLLRTLVAPEALRPADRQGPWPAKDLRTKAFDLVKPTASSALRTKLAEALADHFARLAADDPIRALLLAQDPLNCSAQIALYEKGSLVKETKTKLVEQLTGYSANVLSRLLGVTSEQARTNTAGHGPAADARVKAELDLRLADLLWSEKFCTLVASQLDEQRPLEKQSPLTSLASTIPQDSMRALLAKLLRKRWNDGPKSFETAGSLDKMVTDPGLLVLVKMFPRRDVKTAGRTPIGGPPRSHGAAEKREKAEQEWMAFSSKLVANWCTRFRAAGLAKDKAAAEAGRLPGNAAEWLPPDLRLSENAKVTTAYHLRWPADVPAALAAPKPSPLEIYYLRAEETNTPKRAAAFYTRQLQAKAPETRVADKAKWLDSFRIVPPSGRRRSVDLLLSRADNQSLQTDDFTKNNEETDLVVEILSIEINDPTGRR